MSCRQQFGCWQLQGLWWKRIAVACFIFSHEGCWEGHNVRLSSAHPDRPVLQTWCRDIQTSSSSRFVAPQDDFLELVYSFISQTLRRTLSMYSHPQTKSSALIRKQNNSSPSLLPITPGSSARTNDVDCNGLPCEGARSSYFWFDFHLDLKVWSRAGQASAEHFTWKSLELISLGARTSPRGVDGKRETTAEIYHSANGPLRIPPRAWMRALTWGARQSQTYESNL